MNIYFEHPRLEDGYLRVYEETFGKSGAQLGYNFRIFNILYEGGPEFLVLKISYSQASKIARKIAASIEELANRDKYPTREEILSAMVKAKEEIINENQS